MDSCRLILSFFILITALGAQAEPAVEASKAQKYAHHFQSSAISQKLVAQGTAAAKGVACAGANCVLRNAVAGSQALFLLTSLATAQGAQKKLNEMNLKNEELSVQVIDKAAAQAAEELVSSSTLAAGITGIMTGTSLMKVPLDALNTALSNSSLRPLFKELLSSSAGTLVGFTSFEFGAELMTRGIQMLPNEEDRKKASSMIPLIWGALMSKDPKASKEDLKIASSVIENMFLTLQNDELREKLWSFVMRNRVQTGGFAVAASMVSAGATLGAKVSKCIPNPAVKVAAPVLGALFSTAGVLVANQVPENHKDQITKGLQNTRIGFSNIQLETAQANLKAVLKNYESAMPDWKTKGLEARVDQELAHILKSREGMMTSLFDRIHLLNSKLLASQSKLQMARDNQNPKAEKVYQAEVQAYLNEYQASQSELEKKLSREISFFQKAGAKIQVPAIAEKIRQQIQDLELLQNKSREFLGQLKKHSAWGPTQSRSPAALNNKAELESQRLLEQVYIWGFEQKPFLNAVVSNP